MNIMKSATDLSFVFLPPLPMYLNNQKKKAISVQQGLFKRACGGGWGLRACMSHISLGHVPSILADRKHTSHHISCLAPCCRGTNRSAERESSFLTLAAALKSHFERGSRSARFSWWVEGCVV